VDAVVSASESATGARIRDSWPVLEVRQRQHNSLAAVGDALAGDLDALPGPAVANSPPQAHRFRTVQRELVLDTRADFLS